MRASTGEHYVGLDHIRALAAFLVFTWHFGHINSGHVTPLPGTLWFPPMSLLAEGHTGVSLFMVLSGYIFAKLTYNKKIIYANFLWNRVLRIAPLLLAVIAYYPLRALVADQSEQVWPYLVSYAKGLVMPTLPNGGWSITVEFHFYLLLPLLLFLEARRRFVLLAVVVAALVLRGLILTTAGAAEAQHYGYLTIIGRIDQFIFGILFFIYGDFLKKNHKVGIAAAVALVAYFYAFDRIGGYYSNTVLPGIWVAETTVEGLFYGVIIAYYDRSFAFRKQGLSWFIAKIGEWSYSIYLLHFFFVFRMASYINAKIVPLTNAYVVVAASLMSFLVICALGAVSYELFEKRFLRRRLPYIRHEAPVRVAAPC